jgi:endonuclease/exonuclease/phosphatase (EEP) superfamily protein YafD
VLDRLWWLLAGVTAVIGIAPLAAEHWWPFELISHFRLQFVAVALPLMLLGIVLGRKWAALLLAGVIGLNVWPLLPYLPSRGPTGDGARLTILNANVQATNLEHDRILAVVRESGADIVTVVELSPGLQHALSKLDAEYPHRFMLGREDHFGIGVLSRYELIDPKPLAIGIRPGIEVQVAAPSGQFRFMAVHPVPPIGARMSRLRNTQLARLASQMRQRPDPLVVCGDFNLSPYSPYFDRLQAASGATDTRLGQGLGMSWPQFMPLAGIPIDHCLTRGPFATESVERLDDLGSDHYPVLVTLRWGSEQ